jgi:hypothetical protein
MEYRGDGYTVHGVVAQHIHALVVFFCFVWVRFLARGAGPLLRFFVFYIIIIHGRAVYDWSSFSHVHVCIPWVVVFWKWGIHEAPVSTFVIVYSS